ncbi:MAG TPA: Helicase associated domain protein [Puia sp.]|uniref:Helicase associated domain protein n=1 Tax=Puia sp. TaxID=2045100 RepID=UPI002C11FF07|nr:Helicase associated domain protein [Puia sp.]HVU99606.1 Helicase associated domain protein [Puia sp.]
MQLYPHNQRAYDNAVEIFKEHNRTCIIHPTGTGKAVIIAKFIVSNPTARHLLLAPGEHIAAEVAKHTEGAEFSFYNYNASLSNATFMAPLFDYIYLDEFHRVGAAKWGPQVLKLLAANPDAKVLGTTATHIRFLDDQRNMALELFKGNIASYFSLNQSFLQGILIAPKYISAVYSISQEYRRMEERIIRSRQEQKGPLLKELRSRVIDWENSSGLDVILRKHLPPSRKKLIVFCASLKEMTMAEERLTPILTTIFGAVVSLPVHTRFGRETNQRRLSRFNEEDGLTKVLFTVNMVTEGLHGKDISTVILLRETNSPIIWYQQIGRCFSVGQTEQPVILDLVNNFRNIQHIRFKTDYEEEKAAAIGQKTRAAYTRQEIKPTAVEFVDETQGIREILTSFESRIDRWMIRYLELKAIYERNGNLKVKTKGNGAILLWLDWQRKAFRAGRLSPEKAALLSGIGMIWDNSNDAKWHAHYLEVRKIIEERGQLPPLNRLGKFLANWLTIQKVKYRQNRLKPAQRKLLEEIVSVKDRRMELWTARLKRMETYFAKHKGFPSSKGTGIHRDVFNVRAARKAGTLPKFVEARLTELGFKFSSRQRSFGKGLEALMKFIEENNGSLPQKSTNAYLHWWYDDKCRKFRRGLLQKEHIELFRMQEAATGLQLLPTRIIPQREQSRRA